MQPLASHLDMTLTNLGIGTSGQPCSRSPLGGRIATTLVATISVNIFFPLLFFFSSLFPLFYPSRNSLIEGVLGSKNLFSES